MAFVAVTTGYYPRLGSLVGVGIDQKGGKQVPGYRYFRMGLHGQQGR